MLHNMLKVAAGKIAIQKVDPIPTFPLSVKNKTYQKAKNCKQSYFCTCFLSIFKQDGAERVYHKERIYLIFLRHPKCFLAAIFL